MVRGKNTVDKLPYGVYIKNIVTLWGRKEVADVKKPNRDVYKRQLFSQLSYLHHEFPDRKVSDLIGK